MSNFSTTLAKIVVLTGGAVLGALLARWCDELIMSQARQQSDYDRTRYEQGLAPRSIQQYPPEKQQG